MDGRTSYCAAHTALAHPNAEGSPAWRAMQEARRTLAASFSTWARTDAPSLADIAAEADGTANQLRQLGTLARERSDAA